MTLEDQSGLVLVLTEGTEQESDIVNLRRTASERLGLKRTDTDI